MNRKKEIILVAIILGNIVGTTIPKPYGTVITLVLLVPCVIYIIIDIVKHGNKWDQ